MINGDRIKQVRVFKGLTQTELAKNIEVNQSEIVKIETGIITPSVEILQKIAFQFGFPLSFFKQPTTRDFPFSPLLYRKKAKITKKELNAVYQYSRIFYEVISKFENDIKNDIPFNLPRLDDTPKNAAIKTRLVFDLLPDTPINNLVSIIEKNGVLVIALPTSIQKIDAFSVWVGDKSERPVIVLTNNSAPGDRLRFSIAHELGHLVLHQKVNVGIKQLEDEANSFASEFLMPEDAITKELISPVNLNNLMHLKKRWKVSIQALMLRAYRLEIISSRQYKYLIYQLNNRGWRKQEPIDIPIEKPRFVGQIAETLYGVPIDYKRIATNMNLPIKLIRDTIEVHAIKRNMSESSLTEDKNKVINFTKKES